MRNTKISLLAIASVVSLFAACSGADPVAPEAPSVGGTRTGAVAELGVSDMPDAEMSTAKDRAESETSTAPAIEQSALEVAEPAEAAPATKSTHIDAIMALGGTEDACFDRGIRDSVPNRIDDTQVVHRTWWHGGCGVIECYGVIDALVVDGETREISEHGNCTDGAQVETFETFTTY